MAGSFSFDGYTVRPIGEQDRTLLNVLIEQDEYHRGRMDADFFLKREPGEDSWALENERGEVVFYFKTSTAVRMHIQFGESETLAGRRRNLEGLTKGFRWIEGIFRANRFREIIFDVDSPELKSFSQRRLGFVDASLLSRTLNHPSSTPKSQPDALGTLPTDRLERVG